MQLVKLSFSEFEDRAAELGVELPIEQTAAWARFESAVEGRRSWGSFAIVDGGKAIALISFMDYETHGYHYLRAHHGPVWVETCTYELEERVLAAIAAHVRAHDRRVAFCRLPVSFEHAICEEVLSTVPYDETVVIDLSGTPEDILARMKARGRRDVRKSLRESPAVYADETGNACSSFDEFYKIMLETGERDGFTPAPRSDYEAMMRELGGERCRVFGGRIDGRLVNWDMVTIAGTRASRYYGASRTDVEKRNLLTDGLIYFESCALSQRGCTSFDQMGVGSAAYPGLSSLNTFKSKFAEKTTPVAPDRDLVVKPAFYKALQAAKALRARLRGLRRPAREEPAASREDILPVLLGGDLSIYALGRQFHEAYGVRSIALHQAFIAAIERSSIFKLRAVPSTDDTAIRAEVAAIAAAHPDKRVILMANTDPQIEQLSRIQAELPANVICPIPSAEILALVSDKAAFGELAAKHGLRVPMSQVIDLTGTERVVSSIAFPIVAKPARSARFMAYYEQGFKKVYALDSQDELDALVARLRAAGYADPFILQERIDGDDSCMGAITCYLDADGAMRLWSGAQALLEDHAPTMRGNSVALLTRPMKELRKPVGELLASIGYTGFVEIDVKRDPASGEYLFFEVNPRIGRNSSIAACGGVNPVRVMVDDLVDRKPARLLVADEPALYTLIPLPLLYRYIADPVLLAEVKGLVKEKRVFNPQHYGAEKDLVRAFLVRATELNQIRKFVRFYPKPTSSSF
ncbi:peptidoglycan bridge formation glycyltransferase FemA/FemB family protein [Coriobacteriales bacterium OH1046]|nr:peptidoglycan bridge formation glycyltransferase FemA/FemB family protein [Coriobacteriales bacterium OH1046]